MADTMVPVKKTDAPAPAMEPFRVFRTEMDRLFERFPALRMASVENGAGWVPDLLHRLGDAANRAPRYFRDDPVASFLEHVWMTPFWEDDVEALSASVPIQHLLMGSDWPARSARRACRARWALSCSSARPPRVPTALARIRSEGEVR